MPVANTQLLRQHRISKNSNKIETPTHKLKKINTSSRQSTNLIQTHIMEKNGVELNNTNNISDLKIINNKNEYRKPQSNKDSSNKRKQTLEKHLNCCKKSIIPSNEYSDESNNKTNTNNNIINSERASQIRRSYRINLKKKGNKILQQNKTKEK